MPDVLTSKSFKIVIQTPVNLLVNKFAEVILQSWRFVIISTNPFGTTFKGNGLFPSCPKPLFQSEAKCEAIDVKMISYSHVKNSFSHERFCT